MDHKYTHLLTDRTAVALVDFSKGLLDLATLEPGGTCSLIMEYDDAPQGTEYTEVFAYAERDDYGIYHLNGVEIGDLDQIIQIYSMMCAELIKCIATDEKREDYFERRDAEQQEPAFDNEETLLQRLAEMDSSPESSGDDDEIYEIYHCPLAG